MSEHPSIDLIDLLEKIGTIDKRHETLKKRVDDLEAQMANKANKDEVANSECSTCISQGLTVSL